MADMTDTKGLYIEEIIINSLKSLLSGRVNDLLGEAEFPIPALEFGGFGGGSAVIPVIALSACERSEKERIIRLDAYSLTITFSLPDSPDGERYCYAYAAAVEKALWEDCTLGGIADRVVLTGKKYKGPKAAHCGEGWEVTLSLRLTIEGMGK